jgi:hypothetical protein
MSQVAAPIAGSHSIRLSTKSSESQTAAQIIEKIKIGSPENRLKALQAAVVEVNKKGLLVRASRAISAAKKEDAFQPKESLPWTFVQEKIQQLTVDSFSNKEIIGNILITLVSNAKTIGEGNLLKPQFAAVKGDKISEDLLSHTSNLLNAENNADKKALGKAFIELYRFMNNPKEVEAATTAAILEAQQASLSITPTSSSKTPASLSEKLDAIVKKLGKETGVFGNTKLKELISALSQVTSNDLQTITDGKEAIATYIDEKGGEINDKKKGWIDQALTILNLMEEQANFTACQGAIEAYLQPGSPKPAAPIQAAVLSALLDEFTTKSNSGKQHPTSLWRETAKTSTHVPAGALLGEFLKDAAEEQIKTAVAEALTQILEKSSVAEFVKRNKENTRYESQFATEDTAIRKEFFENIVNTLPTLIEDKKEFFTGLISGLSSSGIKGFDVAGQILSAMVIVAINPIITTSFLREPHNPALYECSKQLGKIFQALFAPTGDSKEANAHFDWAATYRDEFQALLAPIKDQLNQLVTAKTSSISSSLKPQPAVRPALNRQATAARLAAISDSNRASLQTKTAQLPELSSSDDEQAPKLTTVHTQIVEVSGEPSSQPALKPQDSWIGGMTPEGQQAWKAMVAAEDAAIANAEEKARAAGLKASQQEPKKKERILLTKPEVTPKPIVPQEELGFLNSRKGGALTSALNELLDSNSSEAQIKNIYIVANLTVKENLRNVLTTKGIPIPTFMLALS